MFDYFGLEASDHSEHASGFGLSTVVSGLVSKSVGSQFKKDLGFL